MSSVTPLKQGITLHKALAIFFHFPCDTQWIPTKHHEKKQTWAGCFGKQHACSSRHFVFHNLHGISSHSLVEL